MIPNNKSLFDCTKLLPRIFTLRAIHTFGRNLICILVGFALGYAVRAFISYRRHQAARRRRYFNEYPGFDEAGEIGRRDGHIRQLALVKVVAAPTAGAWPEAPGLRAGALASERRSRHRLSLGGPTL
jgi:hypothetical protein